MGIRDDDDDVVFTACFPSIACTRASDTCVPIDLCILSPLIPILLSLFAAPFLLPCLPAPPGLVVRTHLARDDDDDTDDILPRFATHTPVVSSFFVSFVHTHVRVFLCSVCFVSQTCVCMCICMCVFHSTCWWSVICSWRDDAILRRAPLRAREHGRASKQASKQAREEKGKREKGGKAVRGSVVRKQGERESQGL